MCLCVSIGFNNDFLMDVSKRVGTDWRMVVHRLGITDTEIEEIESRHQKVDEKSYEGFYL